MFMSNNCAKTIVLSLDTTKI